MSEQEVIERLEHLRGERDKMRSRLMEIAEELQEVDVSDSEAAVERVSDLTSERAVVKRVLAELEQKLKRVGDELQAVREEANRERIEELQAAYDEKVGLVAQTVKTLQTRIDNAEAVRREMRSLGDRSRGDIPTWLRQAPERVLDYWERRHVVAAGAEPREPYEVRKARKVQREARSRLERAVEYLQTVKAESGRDETDVVAGAQERLQRASERYKSLGGDVSEVLGGPVAQAVRGVLGR